jgi:hypothetical protein
MAEEKKKGFFDFLKRKEEKMEESGPIEVDKVPVPMKVDDTFPLQPGWMPARIKVKGIFDMEGLYKTCAEWFAERNFEFNETMYKAKQPEFEVNWVGTRKKNSYFMDQVDVNLHYWGHWTEVLEGDKKVQRFDGRLDITLKGTSQANYMDIYGEKKWNTILEKNLLNFMNKYVLKKQIDMSETDALGYEILKLHALIKEFLNMQARGNAY